MTTRTEPARAAGQPMGAPPVLQPLAGGDATACLEQAASLARALAGVTTLGAGLQLVAECLARLMAARHWCVLRVVESGDTGALLMPWPAGEGGHSEHLDVDSLRPVACDEPTLGQALASRLPTCASTRACAPAAWPWRDPQVAQVLSLPVMAWPEGATAAGAAGVPVAAIEWHDGAAPDAAMQHLLDLAAHQLGQVSRRLACVAMRRQADRHLGRVGLLASRLGRHALITDAQGQVEWVHPQVAQLLGHPADALCGRLLWEALARDLDELSVDRLAEGFAQREGFRLELALTRRDRLLPVTLELDVRVAVDEVTGSTHHVCLCRDATERGERLLGVDEARAMLAALAETLPVGLLALDARTLALMTLNRQAQELLGLQVPGRESIGLDELMAGGAAAALESMSRQALTCTRPLEQELAWPRADGERLLSARHVAVRNPRGVARLVLVQLTDITRLRRDQRHLRESEQRYRELVESIDEGVFISDPQRGGHDYLSPRMLDLMGASLDVTPLHPRHLREHLLPEDLALLEEQEARERQGQATDVILRLQHPRRGLRWLRRRARGRQLADGSWRVYGLCSDITAEQVHQQQLQAARDAAEAASLAKSQFMATLSHEIRTPMNGILGMTELLLGSPLGERQRRHALAVYRSGENLLEVLDGLLDFAKFEAGRLELHPVDFAPRTLLRDTLDLLAPRAHAQGLTLQLDVAAAVPDRVRADAVRLRQVITNLLGNAIKFTERGGVQLSLRGLEDAPRHGDGFWLECSVRDTGIGIDEQALPLLFQAFTQVHQGPDRRHAGTGLGLAISRQLVQAMRGTIEVDSQPGVGSTFRFTFRVEPAQQGTEPAGPVPAVQVQRAEAGAWPRARVLVVEDNRVNQEVIAQMLRQAGCQVRVCDNGEQALAAAAAQAHDLVFTDIHMPGMDGIELLRRLRRGPAGAARWHTDSRVPVVAVTALGGTLTVQQLLEHGFWACLSKPLRQRELRALLPDRAGASSLPEAQDFGEGFPILDPSACEQLRRLDPDGQNRLVERVLTAFAELLDRSLPTLQAGGERAHEPPLRTLLHTLKSSAAQVGARALAQACRECEHALQRDEAPVALAVRLDAVYRAVQELQPAIRAELSVAPTPPVLAS